MVPQVLHRVLYGSTTPHQVQLDAIKVYPALLPKHRRHRVIGCDYPAVVQSSDDTACVRGSYVEGLTAADMWRLDIFEGDEYERTNVPLRLLDEHGVEGEEKVAETYRWILPISTLEDQEWDFEEFRRDKLKDWVGGSATVEYYDGKLRPSIAGAFCSSCSRSDWGLIWCLLEVDEAVAKVGEEKNGTGGRFVDGSLVPQHDGSQTDAGRAS